jgi:preprotein translocase subunit SecF
VLVLVLFLTVGLNFGIDFRGGTLMEMQAKSGKPDIAQVRQTAQRLRLRRGRGPGVRQRRRPFHALCATARRRDRAAGGGDQGA